MLKIVKLWAPWCGPCKMMKPIVEKLQKEFNFELEDVNIDEGIPESYKDLKIASVPTLLIFWNGEFKEMINGFKSEIDLKTIINKYLETV